MPSFFVERTDLATHPARCVRAERDRKNDDIPLVALHIFKILYKYRLMVLFRIKERFQARIRAACLIKKILDQSLLRPIERDDSKRAFPGRKIRRLEAVDDFAYDGSCLFRVLPAGSPSVHSVRNMNIF